MKQVRTIADIQKDITESKQQLIYYEKQDETGWDDGRLCISGKKVNMRLVRNHILFYEREIATITDKGLGRWLK